jgi:hypothetical protein
MTGRSTGASAKYNEMGASNKDPIALIFDRWVFERTQPTSPELVICVKRE